MVHPIVHFHELMDKGYGQSGRAVKALCERFDIPVVRLNSRQYGVRLSDYETLMARATLTKETA